jgi:hypothetical protein
MSRILILPTSLCDASTPNSTLTKHKVAHPKSLDLQHLEILSSVKEVVENSSAPATDEGSKAGDANSSSASASYSQSVHLYELNALQSSKYSSFICNNSAISDGLLYISTPIDPLFLALSHIRSSASRYAPLDQVLEGLPVYLKEAVRASVSKVTEVSDRLGEDMLVYKYDEDKVLAWLEKKHARVNAVLATQKKEEMSMAGRVGGGFAAGFAYVDASKKNAAALKRRKEEEDGNFNSGFNCVSDEEKNSQDSAENDNDDDENNNQASQQSSASSLSSVASSLPSAQEKNKEQKLTAYTIQKLSETALLFIAEYLEDNDDHELAKKLAARVGLSENFLTETKAAAEKAPLKRKAAWENEDVETDKLLEYTMGGGGAMQGSEAVKLTANNGARQAKKLANVSTKGMKSLSSFFAPKKK